LKGLISTYDASGFNDVLADSIVLFEQARRITKTLSSSGDITTSELDFEISDIELIDAKLASRFEQMRNEVDLRDLQFQHDMESASADVNDILRRQIAATALLVLIVTVGVFGLSGSIAGHLLKGYALQLSGRWMVGGFSGLLVAAVMALIVKASTKDVGHLMEKIKKGHEEPSAQQSLDGTD
jgi:hypothetical protein